MGTYEIGVEIPEGDYLLVYSGPDDSLRMFPYGIYSDPEAENEIEFIHNATTDKKKEEIYDKVRKGIIR